MITLRCSALPLAFACPGSVRGDLAVTTTHPAAELGTGAHLLLRPLAEGGTIDWEAIPQTAQRYGCDPGELAMLLRAGVRLWEHVDDAFPGAVTEVPMASEFGAFRLTGHADLLSLRPNQTVGLGDWKSGRNDANHAHQMRGYCALALDDNPDATEATATILWLRDCEAEGYTMAREQLPEWIADVTEHVVQWDGTYHPGAHCQYCPRSHDCAAATALVRRDVAAFRGASSEAAEANLARMTPDQILTLAEQARVVSGLAYRVREAIKAHVREHGDIVANGQRLTIDTTDKREFLPLLAWPVLEAAGFSDDDFAACVRLGVTATEKRAASKAGRGKGAGAVRALRDQLEAAGAIAVNQTETLRTRRS